MAAKKKAAKPAKPAKPAAKAAETVERSTAAGFKVRALQTGYYNDERKREGDVFMLKRAGDFSDRWMERVDKRTPERTTTSQEVLDRESQKIRDGATTGGANPLDAE